MGGCAGPWASHVYAAVYCAPLSEHTALLGGRALGSQEWRATEVGTWPHRTKQWH